MISGWILGYIWDPMKSLFLVGFGGTAYVPPICWKLPEVAECESFRILLSRFVVLYVQVDGVKFPFLPTAGSMLVVYPPGNDHIPQRLERIFIFPTALAWDMLHFRNLT